MKSKNTEILTDEGAYQYSLRLLALRDYTVQKLSGKLAARSVTEPDIDTTILRLQKEGWVDDRRYAERFAESALSSGRFFGLRLRLEMRRRGISVELADEVMMRAGEEHDEIDELRRIIAHRYPGFVFADAVEKEKRRIISWLQRRGFRISSIMQALRTVKMDGFY